MAEVQRAKEPAFLLDAREAPYICLFVDEAALRRYATVDKREKGTDSRSS
jgi:hypothetical protein